MERTHTELTDLVSTLDSSKKHDDVAKIASSVAHVRNCLKGGAGSAEMGVDPSGHVVGRRRDLREGDGTEATVIVVVVAAGDVGVGEIGLLVGGLVEDGGEEA